MAHITPVTVVCGPPGAGKSTYVKDRMKWGDLVLDLDELYRALSGLPQHDHPDCLVPFALAARDAIINKLAEPSDVRHAWIIMGGAKRAERNEVRETLKAEIIILEVPTEECLRRIMQDPTRRDCRLWQPIVERWWKNYQPSQMDTVIKLRS